MRKKFILISKYSELATNGPGAVVKKIHEGLQNQHNNYDSLLLDDGKSKTKYLYDIVKKCIIEHDAVINVHSDGFLIALAVYLCSIINHKNNYYLTVHGLYCVDSQNKKQINRFKKNVYVKIEKVLLIKFEYLICVSQMIATDIETKYGRSKNIIIIPNASDARSSISPMYDGKLKMIFLGGLKKAKGIDNFIQLCVMLKKNGIDFYAEIYGNEDGNMSSFSESLISGGIEKAVFFRGMERKKQVIYDALSRSDVQICFSVYDSFNIAIAESLVLGCPVVTSDRCGAATLVDAPCFGLVVNLDEEAENSYKKTIEYLRWLVECPDHRLEAYNNREIKQETLSWDNVVNQYSSLT